MKLAFKNLAALLLNLKNFTVLLFNVKNLTVFYRHIFTQTWPVLTLVLICLSSAQAASNEDFGRLFSRPAERAKLDFLRQNQALKPLESAESQGEDIDALPAVLPAPITLQGYVKRSDGSKSTLWINNQPVQEDTTINDVEIGKLNQRLGTNAKDSLDIKIPANGKRIRLKAGQMYDPETNQIKELRTVEKEKRLNLQETGEINSNHDDGISE